MKRNLFVWLTVVLVLLTGGALADTLRLPEGVTRIEDEAFYGDTSLDRVVLPDGMLEIGDCAFAESSLQRIYLPESLATIGENAFPAGTVGFGPAGTAAAAYFEAAEGLTYEPEKEALPTGYFTFNALDDTTCEVTGYTGPTDVDMVIPDRNAEGLTVTAIGDNAFEQRSDLKGALVLPDTLTRIGDYAFARCTGFTGTLVIPDSVTHIGDYAFRSSNYTGSPVLSDHLTSIGDYAFACCYNFTGSLALPDSLTSIGERAFDGCYRLNGALVIPRSLTSIGKGAFSGCKGFTGSLVIPDGVTAIGDYAFTSCEGFDSVTLSDSLASIGECAFQGCKGMAGTLTIPNGLTAIARKAFDHCSGLTGTLLIPGSVTDIGDYAFDCCSGLTGSLTIPDSVTRIGCYAFRNCYGFTGSLTIGSGVERIEQSAFYYCKNFKGTLTIGSSVKEIGRFAFEGCSGFTGDLTIPDSVTSMDYYAFRGCSGFTGNLTIGNGLLSIGDEVFKGCSGFTGSLTIGSNVWSIGQNAFRGCRGFTGSLTIPDGVTYIGNSAFDECKGFDGTLTIPNGVTRLGNYAFYKCSGFTGDLIIPNSLKAIEVYTFAGCSGFDGALMIPDSVTSIGAFAFDRTDGLIKTVAQLTAPDGTVTTEERTAVYCPRGSAAWTWAAGKSGFEPVEWDGETMPGYVSWTGYVQVARVNTYPDAASTVPNGYVDHADPVTVLDAAGNRYYIQMTLSAGGTAMRWVDKRWINTTAWQNDSASYYGTITSADGVPLSDVSVCIGKAETPDETVAVIQTNRYGEWRITGLPSDQAYEVGYFRENYSFVDSVAVTPSGRYYTATASLDGSTGAGACTFEIRQNGFAVNSAVVGTVLDFEVTAPDASYVTLVVDGIAYEDYNLENGAGTFQRAISKGGMRSVKLLAYDNDGLVGTSSEKTIEIQSNGDLDAPTITSAAEGVAGTPYPLTWTAVNHATGYTVYLYHDTQLLCIWKTENCELQIPGDLMYEWGEYFVEVIASGVGYSQQSAASLITIANAAQTAAIQGTAVNQNGEAIQGATLILRKSSWSQWYDIADTVSGISGEFTFDGLTPGCTYTLFWYKEGYGFSPDHMMVTAGDHVTLTGEELGHGSLYLSAPGVTHWKDANVQILTVYAPGAWTAATNLAWCEISQNDNELTVSMLQNTTGETRSGTIVVTCGNAQVTLPVVQEPGDSLTLNARGVTPNPAVLEKADASELLNFIFGDETVTHKYVYLFGWNVKPEVEDYWRVLTGDTKKMSADTILATKKKFLAITEARLLLISNGILNGAERATCTRIINQYNADGYISSYDLSDGVHDIIANIKMEDLDVPIGGFDVQTLMNVELWNAAFASAALTEDTRRVNSARQLLYEINDNRQGGQVMRNLYYNEATTSIKDAKLSTKAVQHYASILNAYKQQVKTE